MLLNDRIKYNDKEIIEKGSRILIKELGYAGFLRFIRQLENSGEDYINIQDEIYKNVEIDELYQNAKNNRERK